MFDGCSLSFNHLRRSDEEKYPMIPARSRKTFGQRLRSTALWWGLPMLCAELIGVPRSLWGYVVVFALPATMAGVFGWAALEHFAIARKDENNVFK
jgi:hypothetical protein